MLDANHTDAGPESSLSLLEQALQNASATRMHKRSADFAEAYPTIEQYLARKVPQKAVLEQFNAIYGHTLHPPRFRKMLEDERARRHQAGETVSCGSCGRELSASVECSTESSKGDGE